MSKIDLLKQYDDLYFNKGTSPLTDTEYDILKQEAKNENPNDPYFKTVGAPIEIKYMEIDLPFIMGGLTKVTPDDIKNWIKNRDLTLVISEKLDGNSILCTWDNGNLIFAAGRGDGNRGQDILQKAKYFIPTNIPYKGKLTLRGEVLLTSNLFESLGFKNRRNGVAGLIRRDLINPLDLKKLTTIFYELVEGPEDVIDKSESSRLMFIKDLGLNVVKYVHMKSSDSNIENKLCNLLLTFKKESNYDIDGLVITIDDSSRENVLYPKNKIKFKVNESAKITRVTDIEWNVTRTGLLKPVILVEPIEIGGVTVSRASGFNYEFILKNSIGINSKVGIVRSGDVIPYVTEIIEATIPEIPKKCPSCGSNLTINGKELICNSTSCDRMIIFEIAHFFMSMGTENISDKTISALGVKCIYDMFNLKKEEISKLVGFGERKAEIILNELQRCLITTPDKILSAFGIPMIGSTLSKQLCSRFTIEELFSIKDPDKLGLGPIISKSFIDNAYKYKPLYEYLLSKGLKFKEDNSEKSLKNIKFSLTGEGPMKRNEIQKLIESKGGQVKGISKDVNFLVTNNPESSSNKTESAKKYGVQIISYDILFEKYLN